MSKIKYNEITSLAKEHLFPSLYQFNVEREKDIFTVRIYQRSRGAITLISYRRLSKFIDAVSALIRKRYKQKITASKSVFHINSVSKAVTEVIIDLTYLED